MNPKVNIPNTKTRLLTLRSILQFELIDKNSPLLDNFWYFDLNQLKYDRDPILSKLSRNSAETEFFNKSTVLVEIDR